MIEYKTIKNDPSVNAYIHAADASMRAIGYTDHGPGHVSLVAETARYILETLGYSDKEVELAQVAAYLHDIGNLLSRVDHAQSGAMMAFQLLTRMGAQPEDIAIVVTAIGNHDERTAEPINAVTAALILADKTDVRRTRVRNSDPVTFDIHDRVNYSVKKAAVKINEEQTLLKLKLSVDTRYGSIMDYFEIFLERMMLCRKACEKLSLQFKLIINEQQLL